MKIKDLINTLDKADIAKIVGLITAVAAAAGTGGWLANEDEPAICLDSPFSMRLLTEASTNDYDRLVLTEDPTLGQAEKGRRFLRLRQVKSAFEIEPRGVVVAQDFKKSSAASLLDSLSAVSSAEAADEPFSFGRHENDLRFKEWTDPKTGWIMREYSDECLLTYRNDRGKSEPSTFRWVRKTH